MGLLDIHNAVADVDVTMANGEIISAWRMVEVKTKVVSDHFPRRLILPPGTSASGAVADFSIVTRGASSITWRITDLLLYKPVSQGSPPAVWERLTEYIGQYIKTFQSSTHRKLGLQGVLIDGFSAQAAVYQWPDESGQYYHGAEMTLLVKETIC